MNLLRVSQASPIAVGRGLSTMLMAKCFSPVVMTSKGLIPMVTGKG